MASKLTRSTKNKLIGGVCGGVAETYNLDPSVVRIATVAAIFFSASIAFWVYIFAWLIIPKE